MCTTNRFGRKNWTITWISKTGPLVYGLGTTGLFAGVPETTESSVVKSGTTGLSIGRLQTTGQLAEKSQTLDKQLGNQGLQDY